MQPTAIADDTRFKEDFEADSLDLYTLVQELEDTYGVQMSDEQAAKILTVGQAGRLRPLAPRRSGRWVRMKLLSELLDELPETWATGLYARVVERAARGLLCCRLAVLLGDSVLALAVQHIFIHAWRRSGSGRGG